MVQTEAARCPATPWRHPWPVFHTPSLPTPCPQLSGRLWRGKLRQEESVWWGAGEGWVYGQQQGRDAGDQVERRAAGALLCFLPWAGKTLLNFYFFF